MASMLFAATLCVTTSRVLAQTEIPTSSPPSDSPTITPFVLLTFPPTSSNPTISPTISPTSASPTSSPLSPSPSTAPTSFGDCIVTSKTDNPTYSGPGKTLRDCIGIAMNAGGEWNIQFDVQDTDGTPDAIEIELEDHGPFANPNITGWVSESPDNDFDNRAQIGFRIYENPDLAPLKITIDGTTQPLNALNPSRETTAKRVVIKPLDVSTTLIFAQIGLKGHPQTNGGQLMFKGLRICDFASDKWNKGLNQKFGGFIHQTTAPQTTITDCELESIPFTIVAGEFANNGDGHYITVENTRAIDVAFVLLPNYNGALSILNSEIKGPAMCSHLHVSVADCTYATIAVQGRHVSPFIINDTVISRGITGLQSSSSVAISCQPFATSTTCGFHNHIKTTAGGMGILLFAAPNSKLTNVLCNNNHIGVYLYSTTNTMVEAISLDDNLYGIYATGSHYVIDGGVVSRSRYGHFDVDTSDVSVISGVTFHGGVYGMFMTKSTLASAATPVNITSCSVFDNSYGILIGTRDGVYIHGCFVNNNKISNIVIEAGDGNTISSCVVGANEQGLCPTTIVVGAISVLVSELATNTVVVNTHISCGVGPTTALSVRGSHTIVRGCVVGVGMDLRVGKVGRWKIHLEASATTGFKTGIEITGSDTVVEADTTTLLPMVVCSCLNGVVVTGSRNRIVGFIGLLPDTSPEGTSEASSYRYAPRLISNQNGIVVAGAINTTIGTTTGPATLCVITGNAKVGVHIEQGATATHIAGCLIGLAADGESVFKDSGNGLADGTFGGIVVNVDVFDTVIGSSTLAATYVGGHQYADAIMINSPSEVYNAVVGLTLSRKFAAPNQKHGIVVHTFASGTVVGEKKPNRFPVIGGNRQDGIRINADNVTINAAMVGIVDHEGTVIGNGGTGIYASHRSANVNFDDCTKKTFTIDGTDASGDIMKAWVIVGGNGWFCEQASSGGCAAGAVDAEFCGAGIQVNSRHAVVKGCLVGVVSDATQQAWVPFDLTTCTHASTSVVCANETEAFWPTKSVSDASHAVRKIAGGEMYYDLTDHSFERVYCPHNAEVGIRFNEHSYFGEVRDNAVFATGGRCILNPFDIDCEGDGIHISIDYSEQTTIDWSRTCYPCDPYPPDAIDAGNDFPKFCDNTTIEDNLVVGAQRYGIFVRADNTSFGVHGNMVESAHRRGVRIWTDVAVPTSTDAHKSVFSDSTFQSHHHRQGSAQDADLTIEDPNNSLGMHPCVFCECHTITYSDGGTPSTLVDCANKRLLSDQLRSLPVGTTHVFMRGAELEVFPWGVLKTINTTLTVLDLGENPKLNSVPRCNTCQSGTFADFGKLHSLTLEGTNLSTAHPSLFTAIAPILVSLDITGLSTNPDVVFEMVGTQDSLAALAWFNISKCPKGYFGALEPPSCKFVATSLCMRCPSGTEQIQTGMFLTDTTNPCTPCSSLGNDFVDDDYDPATACVIPPEEDRFHLDPTNVDCVKALAHAQSFADGFTTLTRTESYKLPPILGDQHHPGCHNISTAFVNYFDTDVTDGAIDGSESIIFTVKVVGGDGVFNDVFVTPADGEVLIIPATLGSFELRLQVADGAGVIFALVTWKFDVIEADTFQLSPKFQTALDNYTASGETASCLYGSANVCYTQQPLRWALPLNNTRSELFLNERETVGDAPGEGVRFVAQLISGPANHDLDYMANEVTGEVFVYATIAGEYTLRLIALNRYTDVAGKSFASSAHIKSFTFTIEVKPQLSLTDSPCGLQRQRTLQQTLDNEFNNPRRDLNATIAIERFVPETCGFADVFNNVGADTDGSLQLRFYMVVRRNNAAPPVSRRSGVGTTLYQLGDNDLINTGTGQFGSVLSKIGDFSLSLVAETFGQDDHVELVSLRVDVRAPDTDNATNGPNGEACSNNAEMIDTTPQDDAFTCACVGSFTGDTCGTVAALVTDETVVASKVAVPLGAIILLLGLVLVTFRWQIHRLNQRAVDIGSIQDKLLHEMGLSTPLDIGPHEFGLTITFDNLDIIRRHASVSPQRLEFEAKVVLTLKKLRPSLHSMLDLARVSLSEHGHDVLIVIPKPQGFKQGFEEQTASILKKQASTRSFSTNGAIALDVSLAVPKRIPREIHRSCLLRLEPLGVGNFAMVDKYQVTEVTRGTPTYFAAVKCVKPGADTDRESLLKEAAIMALFDHRHVVTLIGICSAPRDMPALLVIEFCENGTLEDYLVDDADMDTMGQLTFCADICRGLEYLSNRRVVHRDIAARNVLLDSTLTCKVSDFGMSRVLPPGEQFVVVKEPVPVRWAAPELLIDEKFSTMSDVFSFGVLMYEIFSHALIPYSDIENVRDVDEYIRQGGYCARPKQCPAEIYDKLVVPCFEFKPEDRPTFVEIHDIAIDLGGIDEAHDASMKPDHLRNNAETMAETLTYEEKLKLLGPSIHHLDDGFRHGIEVAVNASLGKELLFHDTEQMVPLKSVADATIRHMVEVYGKPAGEKVTCPRDSEMGAAYVDTLEGDDDVGVATALLSYTWGYKVFDVIDTLVSWAEQDKSIRDKKRTYIWICSLCLNQHRILHTTITPEALAIEFGTRVLSIGRILPMLEPWHSPTYVTRVWCLFELFTAIKNRRHIAIEIIIPPNERLAFKDAVLNEGEKIIDDALQNVNAENATASVAADEMAIKALIQTYQGGFPSLDSTIVQYLHEWFVSMGATKVATRLVNRTTTHALSHREPSTSSSSDTFYKSTPVSKSTSNASNERSANVKKSTEKGNQTIDISVDLDNYLQVNGETQDIDEVQNEYEDLMNPLVTVDETENKGIVADVEI